MYCYNYLFKYYFVIWIKYKLFFSYEISLKNFFINLLINIKYINW